MTSEEWVRDLPPEWHGAAREVLAEAEHDRKPHALIIDGVCLVRHGAKALLRWLGAA